MNKVEKTCLAFIKAVAEDRFETAADAKTALDALDPEKIYVLHELVDSFLLSSLWEAAEEEEAGEMDEDEDDFDDEDEDDFDDEDEITTAPVVRITKKTAKKASKKASGRR